MYDVTIVATTWLPPGNERARWDALIRSYQSWQKNLVLTGGLIHLHIADDGSNPDYWDAVTGIASRHWQIGNVSFSRQQRRGVGASLNAGIRTALNNSPIILHAVDDWELLEPLNLTPWVEFMEDPNYDVGMVRFFPHPDLTGTVRHIPPHGWAVALERHHYVFGFRPCLWHQRFFDALGYFQEGVSSLAAEEDFNLRLTSSEPKFEGERIWLALPEVWRPIETGSLAEVVPG